MREALLALGLFMALALAAVIHAMASPLTLLGTGTSLVGVGLLVGLPAGLMYHVRLYQDLARRQAVVPKWFMHPTRLHPPKNSPQGRPVWRWFYVGATSAGAIFVGCALALLASLRMGG
jgi:hypothetical protein